ncbi:L-Aspartase-like protein [Gymnopilus junonius]|uniref:L-Aspartase-like protein n=1 Tax=Gymnopilus junonius TaxID=109634 RepID=A0A9P5TEW1_GYMJU|nr:L-Aspartase-like protein [Gymnopilus junonius]
MTAIVAAARYSASVKLDDNNQVKEYISKSRQVVVNKVATGASIYGLSTGFSGMNPADARTDKPVILGHALLQYLHISIMPTSNRSPSILPLQDPTSLTTMPESWVQWELIKKMNELICADITPVIPLRGSISALGDLSPLSYIAGTLVGNLNIQVYYGPRLSGFRQKASADEVLGKYSIAAYRPGVEGTPRTVNGTAVSAAVASTSTMGMEALGKEHSSFAPFIHAITWPHPGQVECAQNIYDLLQGIGLDQDHYSLKQDHYPLCTAPQFLGPQIEDILSALDAVTQECNSTTDNPLVENESDTPCLASYWKAYVAQSTELCNPAMNNGLPPSLAATDPSLNYHGKGVDTTTTAYVAELGFLAGLVSTHIQSAEMHNQVVKRTPAAAELRKTMLIYKYIRKDLGIKMHGGENYVQFANGTGVEDVTIGYNISKIYEAICDGRM